MKPKLFAVIYKTTHTRCNKYLSKSDYRIKSFEDLKKIQLESKPIHLYRSNYLEETEPTLLDVFLIEGLSAKPFVENFLIAKFSELQID
jgi:hypothetical protein